MEHIDTNEERILVELPQSHNEKSDQKEELKKDLIEKSAFEKVKDFISSVLTLFKNSMRRFFRFVKQKFRPQSDEEKV